MFLGAGLQCYYKTAVAPIGIGALFNAFFTVPA